MDFLCALIVLILFAVLLLLKSKKENLEEKGNLLGRYNCLRGLFALEIIVGHCVQGEQTYLFLFENFLCISVAFFFFVSAYGMTLSYIKNENYLKRFVLSKCGYVFMMNTIAFLCGFGLSFVTGLKTKYVPEDNIVSAYFSSTNWYVWEIMAFYILFYVAFKLTKRYRWISCLIVVLVATLLMYEFNIFESYYTAAFAFPLGIFAGENDDLLKAKLSKKWKYCVVVSILLMIIGFSCFIIPGGNIYRDLYLRNIMAVGIILGIGTLLNNFSFKNRTLDFLSRYSAGLYFFQFIFLELCNVMRIRYYVKIPIVVLGAIIMSLITNEPAIKIKKVLKNSIGG